MSSIFEKLTPPVFFVFVLSGLLAWPALAVPCKGERPSEVYKRNGEDLDALVDTYLISDLICWEMMQDEVAGKALDRAIELGKAEPDGPQENGRHLKAVIGDPNRPPRPYDLQQDHDLFMAMLFADKNDKLYQPIWGDAYTPLTARWSGWDKNMLVYIDPTWKQKYYNRPYGTLISATIPDLSNVNISQPPYFYARRIGHDEFVDKPASHDRLVAFSLTKSLIELRNNNAIFYDRLMNAGHKYEYQNCRFGVYFDGQIIKSVYAVAIDHLGNNEQDAPEDLQCIYGAFLFYGGLINVATAADNLLMLEVNLPDFLVVPFQLSRYTVDERFYKYLMLVQPRPGASYEEVSSQFMEYWPKYMAGERNFKGVN